MCVTYISHIPLCLCLCLCVCVCTCVWVVCVQKASVHNISVYAGVFTENLCGKSEPVIIYLLFMNALEYLRFPKQIIFYLFFFIYFFILVYIYFFAYI